jgi:hypothetical protein
MRTLPVLLGFRLIVTTAGPAPPGMWLSLDVPPLSTQDLQFDPQYLYQHTHRHKYKSYPHFRYWLRTRVLYRLVFDVFAYRHAHPYTQFCTGWSLTCLYIIMHTRIHSFVQAGLWRVVYRHAHPYTQFCTGWSLTCLCIVMHTRIHSFRD